MSITHKVGNPNAQIHLILTNSGGRLVRVTRIALAIRRDGKDIIELPAINYLQHPNDDRSVLFTRVTLKPTEEWAHVVTCLNIFSRADEKLYRAAELKLRRDIGAKRLTASSGKQDMQALVEADAETVTPFEQMFDRFFIWAAGEYDVRVTVTAQPERASVTRTFRFTLFESDSAMLSGVRSDYRFGDGVYWNSDKYGGVLVQVVEA